MFIKYWAALTALVLFIPNISFAEHVRTRFNQAEFLRLQFGGGNQKPLSLPPDNDGIHLAISPQCGQLSGNPADINAGIDSGKIRTIVSFGDSYTDGGKDDGSPLNPPILVPPSPLAGGRSTNGLTWVENVANDVKATIMDYAQSGACIDLSLWPSNPRKVDFLGQMQTFLGQNNDLNPNTTLYSIFFGINVPPLAALSYSVHVLCPLTNASQRTAIICHKLPKLFWIKFRFWRHHQQTLAISWSWMSMAVERRHPLEKPSNNSSIPA
ncbi:hypothetical protein Ac2012v2_007457 [Leucoagaricus gongylophorus]